MWPRGDQLKPTGTRSGTLLAILLAAGGAAAHAGPPSPTSQPVATTQPALSAEALRTALGVWQMNSTMGGNIIEATMTLTAEHGRLLGTWRSLDRDMPLEDVRLLGNELTFRRVLTPDRSLTYRGTISGNKITGAYQAPFGEIVSNGVRLAPPKPEPAPPGPQPTHILDGIEKSIVILGTSTSYGWPALLQNLLDDHAGSQRTYHVLNAAVGGGTIARWNAASTSKPYQATFGIMLRDYLGPTARILGPAPPPSIALCQLSLQRIHTPAGPVGTADDTEGIQLGADALEQLARRLHSHGIEHCFVATDMYSPHREPHTGNDRFCLPVLLSRGHRFIHAGPDLWSRTWCDPPQRLRHEDGVNPNEAGAKVIAEAWYRTLAGAQANEQAIQIMHQKHYDISTLSLEYLRSRNPRIAPPPRR